jgi:hypothetical protein
MWEGHDRTGAYMLLIASDGSAAIGCCDGLVLPMQGRYQRNVLDPMQARFASFKYESATDKLTFNGKGDETASPAWQRAIVAWVRYTAGSLYVGHPCASCPTKFYWKLQVSQESKQCAVLAVTEFGTAFVTTVLCQADDLDGSKLRHVDGMLTTDEWEQFDTWLYNRDSFQCRNSNLPKDNLNYSASFDGSGSQAMSDDELLKLADWTKRVYGRLTNSESGWPDAQKLDWTCARVK